jgi:hypothetical protein
MSSTPVPQKKKKQQNKKNNNNNKKKLSAESEIKIAFLEKSQHSWGLGSIGTQCLPSNCKAQVQI